MGRASGRAFMAIGQALGDHFARREAMKREEALRAEERAERDQLRRAELLTKPGAYESPDTRLSVLPPELDLPELPQPRTTLREPARPGESSLQAAARSVLGPPEIDVPELPRVIQERTPIPEGHTRPLPGIAFNPRFEAEQETARNRALAEDAIAAGARPELAGLLEHTGPSGLRAVLPQPDEPPTYQFRETDKGIEAFNPRDPTDVVATGRMPPPSAAASSAGAREARIAANERREQLERQVGERALAMVEAIRAAGDEMPVGQLTNALMASFPAEAKPPRAIAEGAAARALTGERSRSLMDQRREQQLAGDAGGDLARFLTEEEEEAPAAEPTRAPAPSPTEPAAASKPQRQLLSERDKIEAQRNPEFRAWLESQGYTSADWE